MNARYIPNLISGLRILLVIPIGWSMLAHDYGLALILFIVAGLSDGLDGYLARRFDWGSVLGKYLDPIGDKLMMVTSYLVLGIQDLLPLWLAILVVLRDIVIVSGTAIYRYIAGAVEIEPVWISKLNTALQILLVVMVLLDQVLFNISDVIMLMMLVGVAITTLLSGYAYVSIWGKQAWKIKTTGDGHGG